MSAYGKYRVIAADSLEERRHHRQLIEEKLQKGGLTSEMHAELDAALKHAIIEEGEAEGVLQREKKTGETETGSQSGGRSGSGSGSGVSIKKTTGSTDNAGPLVEENSKTTFMGDAAQMSELEVFELLFLSAETNAVAVQNVPTTPLDAATLLFDRDESVALVNEPYTAEHASVAHVSGSMLHALEHHVAHAIGARTLMLNVPTDAVQLFRQRGYQVYGATAGSNGVFLQRMRKILNQSSNSLKSGPE